MTTEIRPLFEYLEPLNEAVAEIANTWRPDNPRAVISLEDPGVPNWLDPAGFKQGTIYGRWYECDTEPTPTMKRVKLAELHDHLPKHRHRHPRRARRRTAPTGTGLPTPPQMVIEAADKRASAQAPRTPWKRETHAASSPLRRLPQKVLPSRSGTFSAPPDGKLRSATRHDIW